MKNKIKKYWFELLVTGMLLIGFFLLLEQVNLAGSLLDAPERVLNPTRRTLTSLIEGFDGALLSLSPSDILGISLVIMAFIAVLWRLRARFLGSDGWYASACPKCDSALHRIHRTRLDRFLSRWILPDARRYLCSNRDCRWEGLLHQIHRSDRELHKRMMSGDPGQIPHSK